MQIVGLRIRRVYVLVLIFLVLTVLVYSVSVREPPVDENARIKDILRSANQTLDMEPEKILDNIQRGPPESSSTTHAAVATNLSGPQATGVDTKPKDKPKKKKPAVTLEEYEKSRAQVIKAIFKLISSVRPTEKYNDRRSNRGDDSPLSHSLLTEDILAEFFQFPAEFVDAFSQSHAEALQRIRDIKFPDGLYKGNGVVMIGGDNYSWLTLLAIDLMRKNGGDLPVEVIIPRRDDSEPDFCGKYLPALNAKCVFLTDLLGENFESEIEINKYQYKGIALLASSFENLLLLDSDDIPVAPVTSRLFETAPFTEYGMVFWPDFWKRSTSPTFYKIANCPVENIRIRDCQVNYPPSQWSTLRPKDARSLIPFHDRKGAIPDKSTESGQLLISKKHHADVVLLSLYYNAYGPDGYYSLLSQGVAGEGDKDTFPAAATVLGKEFYQLKKNVGVNGFWRNGDYRGVGMLQYDPIRDYENYMEFIDSHKHSDEEFEAGNIDNFLNPDERNSVMFAHCNFPKLFPDELLHDFVVRDSNEHIKMLGSGQIPGNYEHQFWKVMYDYLCVDRIELAYTKSREQLNDPAQRTKFCEGRFKEHLDWLATQ
ncbi:hypothetical protein OGAPHI_005556 [Ogataea philodendri]|uniref:Alpha-1,2-mannosyltransferase n=1 Tax=Ogataea philodendri TaxID=1378263 RepID=A0A9P8NZU9_9ASCO|nr:uncharacterized protein OGAPHI_005556 [Ogataea philodendri]KAH3662306.1 hypothetical protein OGAPHI_005556 [Ogataea philodendri]